MVVKMLFVIVVSNCKEEQERVVSGGAPSRHSFLVGEYAILDMSL